MSPRPEPKKPAPPPAPMAQAPRGAYYAGAGRRAEPVAEPAPEVPPEPTSGEGGGEHGGADAERDELKLQPEEQAAPAPAVPPHHPDAPLLARLMLPRDSSGGIDHQFAVGGKTSLASGRERHRLGFGSVSYPARIEYLLRPAIREHAFGRVTVTNNEGVPLLAGPAAVFVGEAFFGETEIRTTPAGGKLVLDLGAETSIKCARRTRTTLRTEGLLSREDVHAVEVSIEIENHLPETVELEVQDQVPISKDPKVKVKLMKTSPKDAELDELSGVLTFRARVAAGARAEINVSYELVAPQDYQLLQRLRD